MFKKIVLFLVLCLSLNCSEKRASTENKPLKNSNNEIIKNISWLGECTIRIIDEKVIYFDPASSLRDKNIKKKADIVFISHGHHTRFNNYALKKIIKKDTLIVTVKSCADLIKSNVRVKVVKPGDKFTIANIQVEVIPAYDFGIAAYHKKSFGYVGFIIDIKGKRFYSTGDTNIIPEMKNIKNIDILFVPVGAGFIMKSEVIQLVNIIDPKIVIPVYYGGLKCEIEYFQERLKDRFVYLKELDS